MPRLRLIGHPVRAQRPTVVCILVLASAASGLAQPDGIRVSRETEWMGGPIGSESRFHSLGCFERIAYASFKAEGTLKALPHLNQFGLLQHY